MTNKKREKGLALLQEAKSILATKKSNKPSALEIKALEAAVVAKRIQSVRSSSCYTRLYAYTCVKSPIVGSPHTLTSWTHHAGFLHPLGVEQGYTGNGLRETDVNEYIKQTFV